MKKGHQLLLCIFILFILLQTWGSFGNCAIVGQQAKKFKPVPRVPILLDCQVNLPDSRGVPGVKVALYEILGGGSRRFVKAGETNQKGFCQIKVGTGFMRIRNI